MSRRLPVLEAWRIRRHLRGRRKGIVGAVATPVGAQHAGVTKARRCKVCALPRPSPSGKSAPRIAGRHPFS